MNRPFIDTVESHGWQLYDISSPLSSQTGSQQPATYVSPEVVYRFMPIPKPGQTLRQAYNETGGGIGPSLRVNNPDSTEYRVVDLTINSRMAFFTRFAIRATELWLFSSTPSTLPGKDIVIMPGETAQATFERDFAIINMAQLNQIIRGHNIRPSGQ